MKKYGILVSYYLSRLILLILLIGYFLYLGYLIGAQSYNIDNENGIISLYYARSDYRSFMLILGLVGIAISSIRLALGGGFKNDNNRRRQNQITIILAMIFIMLQITMSWFQAPMFIDIGEIFNRFGI